MVSFSFVHFSAVYCNIPDWEKIRAWFYECYLHPVKNINLNHRNTMRVLMEFLVQYFQVSSASSFHKCVKVLNKDQMSNHKNMFSLQQIFRFFSVNLYTFYQTSIISAGLNLIVLIRQSANFSR